MLKFLHADAFRSHTMFFIKEQGILCLQFISKHPVEVLILIVVKCYAYFIGSAGFMTMKVVHKM
jgi:hypothetical protein